MTANPGDPLSATTRGSPGPALTIRKAARADLPAVVYIEQESFAEPWPAQAFETHLNAAAFLVAVVNAGTTAETIVGYIVADLATPVGPGLGHVKDLVVQESYRGQGIGSQLLERSLVELALADAVTVKLEVRESNETAQSLYQSFGFRAVRRKHAYYQDGEDAIVMMRPITDPNHSLEM